VSGISLLSNIQERMQIYNTTINANIIAPGGTLQFNYASGGIMILPNSLSINGNYVINISGLPTIQTTPDFSKTYVVSTINTSQIGSNCYATGVTINGSAQIPMLFNGGNASIPVSSSNTITMQQVALISTGSITPQTNNVEFALSSVSQFFP
jgi:hypothetical protein